ncbi:MAG: glycosyltransferase, partial [Lachnospiraceae bacterium]|nr:glycosyltransferase [Lachnospiraceae bacterium]
MDMKNSLVSIVMPLYNAAKYLKDTLESVLTQRYSFFELICINDCSTDGTADLLDSYQKTDERIRVLNNDCRMGAGLSRNIGMKEAKGEFLAFWDGDDIFDEDYLFEAV